MLIYFRLDAYRQTSEEVELRYNSFYEEYAFQNIVCKIAAIVLKLMDYHVMVPLTIKATYDVLYNVMYKLW